MAKAEYFKGPPPSLGWWPASTTRSPKVLRWWNGKHWSTGVYADWPAGIAEYYAKIPAGKKETPRIEWSPRPDSWPPESRT